MYCKGMHPSFLAAVFLLDPFRALVLTFHEELLVQVLTIKAKLLFASLVLQRREGVISVYAVYPFLSRSCTY